MSTPTAETGPRREYQRRLEARRATAAALAAQDRRISDGRLAVFVAGLALAWLSLGMRLFSAGWLAAPVLAFLALVIVHDQALRRRHRADRAVAYYERALARLDGRWAGHGAPGERFRDPAHPYAEDLDLFGKGSLFELLCAARTRAGEETLARWLQAPASADEIRARQAAVADLRQRPDLREELALQGEDVRAGVDAEALVRWGAAPRLLESRWVPAVGAALAAATVAALAAWASGASSLPLVVLAALGQALAAPLGDRVRRVVRGVDQPARELALFAELLKRLEAESFEAPLLRDLQAGLAQHGLPPSRQLARLERLVGLLQAQQNGIFAVFGALILWPMQLAFRIEAWRAECGGELERWLAVAGELEALSSLAGYAYEHPDDPFPEIDEEASFRAEGLAHPLLPEAGAVRNDLALGPELRLLLVSGSNMSGKSTLLRSVGTNAVLALAGAPVRARRLRLSVLTIGASIRVQDSLQGGVSRFYAEITRLRQVVDLTTSPAPLLFLLDEILHGTNSHDRRIGAEAVVRALVRQGALGLVTTHDLAITRIVEDPALHAANVHFEDHLQDGQMAFDYHLRAGVVEKSNALELMRAVGLEV